VISPFRGDVVVTGFVLAIPVLLLGLRGDFTAHEVVTRLLWCLAAGWAAVALVRFASTPPVPPSKARAEDVGTPADAEADTALS
jgi:hypothetical protein